MYVCFSVCWVQAGDLYEKIRNNQRALECFRKGGAFRKGNQTRGRTTDLQTQLIRLKSGLMRQIVGNDSGDINDATRRFNLLLYQTADVCLLIVFFPAHKYFIHLQASVQTDIHTFKLWV